MGLIGRLIEDSFGIEDKLPRGDPNSVGARNEAEYNASLESAKQEFLDSIKDNETCPDCHGSQVDYNKYDATTGGYYPCGTCKGNGYLL